MGSEKKTKPEKKDILINFTLKYNRDTEDYEKVEKVLDFLGYNTDDIRTPDASEVVKILMRHGYDKWFSKIKL
ncbi:MAG: hypothetical protein GF364_15080 [Candidatus Lokiarchaeota archaeon]|nr:hypothetical protein [Candidatus Lokiarchaeota archaeon]